MAPCMSEPTHSLLSKPGLTTHSASAEIHLSAKSLEFNHGGRELVLTTPCGTNPRTDPVSGKPAQPTTDTQTDILCQGSHPRHPFPHHSTTGSC